MPFLEKIADRYLHMQKRRQKERKYSLSVINHLDMLEDRRNPLDAEESDRILSVWNKYGKVNLGWFEYLKSTNGFFSPYFIPPDLWQSMVCNTLNQDRRFGRSIMNDKNFLDVLFPNVKTMPILVRNINGQFLNQNFELLTQEEAIGLCLKEEEIVIKPSLDSARAKNVGVFSNKTKNDFVRDIVDYMGKLKKDFVIQAFFKQHEGLAALNPDSVNTVRVYSLLWNNQVRVLHAVVRIGTKGIRVDNLAASNCVACNINSKGVFDEFACDFAGKRCSVLPTGVTLKDYPIPSYDAIVDMVKHAHCRIPHFRMIGWDTTVDIDGNPIVVEANMHYPCGALGQMVSGPMFGEGELFTEIMDFVYGKK